MSLHFVTHAWDVRDVEDGTLVKLFPRELEADNIAALAGELEEVVRHSGRPNLYLDFGAVVYLSSAALGQLILLQRGLKESGGQLTLVNLNPPVRELLGVSRLTDLIDVR